MAVPARSLRPSPPGPWYETGPSPQSPRLCPLLSCAAAVPAAPLLAVLALTAACAGLQEAGPWLYGVPGDGGRIEKGGVSVSRPNGDFGHRGIAEE